MDRGAAARQRESRRTFTVLNTHLSVEPSLKRRQARAIVERALAARRHGPVVLAGDLNVPATGARGRDVEIAATLARLTDMGSGGTAPNIDYVLADGFTPRQLAPLDGRLARRCPAARTPRR